MQRAAQFALVLTLFATPFACSASSNNPRGTGSGGQGGSTSSTGGAATSTATGGAGGDALGDGGLVVDAQGEDAALSPDAACAASMVEAQTEQLPVDIIWMVDNSVSMAPAVAAVQQGINAFATTIAAKSLDYRVIMLALRSATSPITVNGSTRYPVCVPPPLAGDTMCGNGPRFFHSSVDLKSTQPLEQFLGTLAQTTGYQPGDVRGGEPWAQELRANATKTIVVVTDDNSRLTATQFEHFAGGTNPYNASLVLPPGILDPSWNDLFKGFLFDGIYGWGSDTDPAVKCTYPDSSHPPASGQTYTDLVQQSGGVRAHICDGTTAWQPFFDSVAQAVVQASKISCEIPIPAPTMGQLDPALVNVGIVSGGSTTYLPGVVGAAACGVSPAWYYDDPASPTKVILCPAACDEAQQAVGLGKGGSVQVLFGCQTILK